MFFVKKQNFKFQACQGLLIEEFFILIEKLNVELEYLEILSVFLHFEKCSLKSLQPIGGFQ